MRFFIFLLILAAFLQTAIIPTNLCLMLLICRSFVVSEKENFYLGFAVGLFLGVLSSQNVGFWPVIFLVAVKLVSVIRRLPIASNILAIVPVSLVLLGLSQFFESFVFGQSFNTGGIFIGVILSLPAYVIIKFWEERFIVKSDIRLKISQNSRFRR